MRMSGTLWRPSPNCNKGDVIRPARGAVLHTADGTFDGTIGWQQNPASQVSSYFVTAKDGRIAQCVDTDDKAWTQGTGNEAWIGIENEGHGEQGDPLTDLQLTANATIYAWLVRTYGVPLKIADDPNSDGLGWHGMGASVGWGHPACPGEVIKAQRAEILKRAAVLINPAPAPTPSEEPMRLIRANHADPKEHFVGVVIDENKETFTLVGPGASCNPSPSVMKGKPWAGVHRDYGDDTDGTARVTVVTKPDLFEYTFRIGP